MTALGKRVTAAAGAMDSGLRNSTRHTSSTRNGYRIGGCTLARLSAIPTSAARRPSAVATKPLVQGRVNAVQLATSKTRRPMTMGRNAVMSGTTRNSSLNPYAVNTTTIEGMRKWAAARSVPAIQ